MKHFTLLKTWLAMCLLFVGAGVSRATTYRLVQVNSVEAKSKYVFIQDGHAMGSTIYNSSLQTVTDYETTGLEGNENYVWELEKNNHGFRLINCSLSSNPYLKNTSSTNLSFADSGTPTDWTFDFSDPNSVIIKNIDGTRFLGFTNASSYVYKAYAISGLNSHSHAIKVYKLVDESTPSVLYTVSFDANGNGTCATAFLTEETEGAGVTLPACIANRGFAFIGWATTSESSTANAGKANETYTPIGNTNLYAVYKNAYTVTIEEPANGTITVKNGENTVNSGDEAADGTALTIEITPNSGYCMRNWQAVDGSTHTYTTTFNYTINGSNVTIKANFDIEDEAILTIKDGKYGTFVAPFAINLPDGVSAYTVVSVDENGATLSDAITGRLAANTPVLVSGTTGNYNFYGPVSANTTVNKAGNALVGILQDGVTVPANSYVLQDQGAGQKFYKVASAATGKKNRCYLDTSSDVKVLNLVVDGEETAIENVFDEETAEKRIYDLSGRKVNNAQKGIYIVNGKKMLVK